MQVRFRALAHENSVNRVMSDWGKKMVDLWHNKGLVPDARVSWKEFYIGAFRKEKKDMGHENIEHEDIVRGMRRRYARRMQMYECVCLCMRWSMQGRLASSVRRFAAKLAGRRQARVRCAGIQRAVQDEVQPSDRGPEHDAGSQPHVPVPEQEPQDGRENLGRLRGTSKYPCLQTWILVVCKHNT